MRLGDLDDLKVHISELMLVYSGEELDNAILNAIDNAPTVDISGNEYFPYRTAYFNGVADGRATARPQGEWVYRQEWFEDEKEPRMAWGCNQCGFSIKSVHEKRNFCPDCGAAMRKGGKE